MLRFALVGIVTGYEYEKLIGLEKEGGFNCRYTDDLYTELKHLRAMGMIENVGSGLREMKACHKGTPDSFDIKAFCSITDLGREYMVLRKEAIDSRPEHD